MEGPEADILRAVNADRKSDHADIGSAVEEYGMVYVLDCWLKYEGIVGYTSEILAAMEAIGFDVSYEEW